jgi:hypothetical protein
MTPIVKRGPAKAWTLLILVWLIIGLGLIPYVWSIQSEYLTAKATFDHCLTLATDWERLASRPAQIAVSAAKTSDLSSWIEARCQGISLDPKALISINPEQPRRVRNEPYLVQEVQLRLEPLTLSEIVRLLQSLEASESQWVASKLSLTPTARGDQPEKWRVEAVLTKLVFAPITQAGKSP